jgi:hypothetical protein
MNYEWQTGTRVEPVVDVAALKTHVLRYLADCRRWAHMLRVSDHPTLKGCLQVVYTQTDEQKQAATDLYYLATRTRPKPPAGGTGEAP